MKLDNLCQTFAAERQRRSDGAEAAARAAVVGRVDAQALRAAEELRGQERRGDPPGGGDEAVGGGRRELPARGRARRRQRQQRQQRRRNGGTRDHDQAAVTR